MIQFNNSVHSYMQRISHKTLSKYFRLVTSMKFSLYMYVKLTKSGQMKPDWWYSPLVLNSVLLCTLIYVLKKNTFHLAI